MSLSLTGDNRRGSRVLSSLMIAALYALVLSGCASMGTYNPATGRSELIFISTPEEVTLGNQLHQQIGEQYAVSSDTRLVERINRIGRRVAQVSDRQDYSYQFFVMDKDELNAFTIPGGRVYIFTGLIDKLGTDDEIASVLAHEIGHCAARHTIKKFQAAMGYNLISSIILGQVGGQQAQALASLSSNAVMGIVFSAYGRKDEYEADRLGVKYLRAAGYDPKASITVLEVLQRESKDGSVPLMLRSHPHLSDRITAVKEELGRPSGSPAPVGP